MPLRVRPTSPLIPAGLSAPIGGPRFAVLRRTKVGSLFIIYALLFLLGIYLDIPAPGGIPMVSAVPFALIGGLIFLPRVFSPEALGAIGLAASVFALSLLAPEPSTYFGARALAFGQYLYSLFIAVTIYWTILRFSRREINRFTEYLLIAFMILILLELFTPLSNFMDEVMSPLFRASDLDASIARRDLAIGGGLRRPKLFTSETSYVALAYTFTVCVYAWTSESQKSVWKPFAYAAAGLLLIRSPILVLACAFVCLSFLARAGSKGSLLQRFDRLLLFAALSVPVLAAGSMLALELFENRISQVGTGADYSVTYRTYGSLFAAFATSSEFPLTGVGIGSIDLAFQPLTQTYLSLGIPSFSVMREWRFQVANLPSALLIYLGIVGCIFYLVYMYNYISRVSGGASWRLWFLIAVMSTSLSAFYSPKVNSYLFIFLAINRIMSENRSVPELPIPGSTFPRRGFTMRAERRLGMRGGSSFRN